jgi:hypothetical protein
MGRRLVIGAILFLAAAACLAPVRTVWDDGLWPLSVTVTSASGSPIASASCQVDSGDATARSILENLAPPEGQRTSAVADPFVGKPLDVPVPTSCKTSSALLWSSSHYHQMPSLVVIIRYRDGRQEGRLVDIPDLRQTRSLRVEFP